MKKLKSISILAVVVALIISSCTVEKREHLAGYHIEWNKGKSKTNAIAANRTKANEDKIILITPINNTNTIVAATSNEFVIENNSTLFENYSVMPNSKATKMNHSTVKRMEVFNSLKTTSDVKKLTLKQKIAVFKEARKAKSDGGGISSIVYILLAIFIPFVAVGLATDWGIEVLWNILWCLLCGIPGIIHAFIILRREGII